MSVKKAKTVLNKTKQRNYFFFKKRRKAEIGSRNRVLIEKYL